MQESFVMILNNAKNIFEQLSMQRININVFKSENVLFPTIFYSCFTNGNRFQFLTSIKLNKRVILTLP